MKTFALVVALVIVFGVGISAVAQAVSSAPPPPPPASPYR